MYQRYEKQNAWYSKRLLSENSSEAAFFHAENYRLKIFYGEEFRDVFAYLEDIQLALLITKLPLDPGPAS